MPKNEADSCPQGEQQELPAREQGVRTAAWSNPGWAGAGGEGAWLGFQGRPSRGPLHTLTKMPQQQLSKEAARAAESLTPGPPTPPASFRFYQFPPMGPGALNTQATGVHSAPRSLVSTPLHTSTPSDCRGPSFPGCCWGFLIFELRVQMLPLCNSHCSCIHLSSVLYCVTHNFSHWEASLS